jgi:hypothetical protein
MFYKFFPENRTVHEMWEKTRRAGQATDDTTIRRMRFACWVINTIDTLKSDYTNVPQRYVLYVPSLSCETWSLTLREERG